MKANFVSITKSITQYTRTKIDAIKASSRPQLHDAAKEPLKLTPPQTTKELIQLLRLTPATVLSPRERQIISAAMNFSNCPVSKIMLPKEEITFVFENDFLGPLTLDKLYRSGFSHFPVIDAQKNVIGVISTASLNSLAVKKTDRAKKFTEPSVYYLRQDYSLEQALAAFLRTNCFFFLVVNRRAEIVGQLTYQMLAEYLLGRAPKDDFDQDMDIEAVAKRPDMV